MNDSASDIAHLVCLWVSASISPVKREHDRRKCYLPFVHSPSQVYICWLAQQFLKLFQDGLLLVESEKDLIKSGPKLHRNLLFGSLIKFWR